MTAQSCAVFTQSHEIRLLGSNPVRVAMLAARAGAATQTAQPASHEIVSDLGWLWAASPIVQDRLRCGFVHFDLCAHFLDLRSLLRPIPRLRPVWAVLPELRNPECPTSQAYQHRSRQPL